MSLQISFMRIALPFILVLLSGFSLACSTTQSLGSQLDDTGTSTQVRALLLQDTGINALNISVATDENEVFLIGRVPNQEQRLRAEGHARKVAGVWSVINDLKVGAPGQRSQYPDIQLRQAVERRILRDQNVLGLNIRVLTHEGEVYLLGRVTSESERQQALSVTRETEGVLRVHNYLKAGQTRSFELAPEG